LYVYDARAGKLQQLAADLSTIERELPLNLPQACAVSQLYPAPAGGRLVVEMICPNGPLALLTDPGTGTARGLSEEPGMDSHFLAWSQEGDRVYLRVNALADPQIQAVELESLRSSRLPLDAYTYDMAESPDGRRLLFSFSRGLGLGSEMWSVDPAGRNARMILSDPESILAFARWSPGGESIAFIKIPDSEVPYTVGELWLVEADGANPRRLAEADAGHGYAAAWSPDGRRLAFVVRSNPADPRANQSVEALVSNIFIVEAASGALKPVTQYSRGRAETPVWSPAGNTLSFDFVLDGRMEVQIADPDGGFASSIQTIDGVCCPVWMQK
jgi:Tol biopolymer transport system component